MVLLRYLFCLFFTSNLLAEPYTICVIGQSNVASGREGGNLVTHPRVRIWNELANGEAGAWEVWDKSKSPKQASPVRFVKKKGLAKRQENHNTWPHGFSKRIVNSLEREVRVIQSAEAGVSLGHWLTEKNGGAKHGGLLWRNLLKQTKASGVSKFDCLLFDQGESGGSYKFQRNILLKFYRQMLSEGFINEETPIIFREIRADIGIHTEINKANKEIFLNEHKNGFMISADGLKYDQVNEGPDSVHLTGQSHDVAAERASGFLTQNLNLVVKDSGQKQDGVAIPVFAFTGQSNTIHKVRSADGDCGDVPFVNVLSLDPLRAGMPEYYSKFRDAFGKKKKIGGCWEFAQILDKQDYNLGVAPQFAILQSGFGGRPAREWSNGPRVTEFREGLILLDSKLRADFGRRARLVAVVVNQGEREAKTGVDWFSHWSLFVEKIREEFGPQVKFYIQTVNTEGLFPNRGETWKTVRRQQMKLGAIEGVYMVDANLLGGSEARPKYARDSNHYSEAGIAHLAALTYLEFKRTTNYLEQDAVRKN